MTISYQLYIISVAPTCSVTVRRCSGSVKGQNLRGTVQLQGISKAGSGDTRWLRHQLCCRAIACIHIWSARDSRTPILQVYTPGRPLWCGRVTTGSASAVHATYCTHLPAWEGRGLLGTVWLGSWLGSSASRYVFKQFIIPWAWMNERKLLFTLLPVVGLFVKYGYKFIYLWFI